jgi:hypothetical protein
MLNRIKSWCDGKLWIIRAPVSIFCIYIAIKHFNDPMYTSIFGGLNLGIHEMGHFLFFWTTQFWYVAGGTILQLFIPILTIFLFMKQPDYFGVSFAGVWLGTNLYYVAMYLGDARSQILPLVSIGGGESKHDWTYLLTETKLILSDKIIASEIRFVAFLVIWVSIVFGVWLLYQMSKSKRIDIQEI